MSRGETRAATEAFLRSRDLDLQVAPPPWTLSPEAFVHTAERVLGSLDERYRAFIRLDELFVTDLPGVEVVADGVDPRAVLLLDGITAEEDGSNPTARLFLYQRNVERLAGSVDRVEPDLFAALEREIEATFLEPILDEPPPPPKANHELN
jgi:hypothetical protein